MRKFVRAILCYTCWLVLSSPSLVEAQPQVASVDGSFGEGVVVTIHGSDFGTKPVAEPLLWDTVTNQPAYDGLANGAEAPVYADGDCPDCPWRARGPFAADDPPKIYRSGDEDRVPDRGHYYLNTKGFFRSFGFMDDDPDAFYVNWWVRSTIAQSAWSQSSSKILRACASEQTSYSDVADTRMSLWGSALLIVTGANPLTSENVWNSLSLQPNEWHNMEAVFDNRQVDGWESRGGRVTVKRDGYAVHDTTFGGQHGVAELYVIGFDPSVTAPYESDVFEFGEVYIDTTQARVVVANASDLMAATHTEVQIPVSWTESLITVTANAGTFSAGEQLYFFVYDRAGRRNQMGFPVEGLELSGPGIPGTPYFVN